MKKLFFLAAVATMTLASCMNDEFVGAENSPTVANTETDAINFGSGFRAVTRADQVGADAADLLGNQFVVLGVKGDGTGTDQTPVFKNYKVTWTKNTAGTTESNTSDWEYVGVSPITGITGVSTQTIKYWDYSATAYDFAAYSAGKGNTIVTTTPGTNEIKASAISYATSSPAAGAAYTLSGTRDDLTECYITDMLTVAPGYYGNEVVFNFRSLASKVRMAIYETVPGYSVKAVKFHDVTGVIKNSTTSITPATSEDATLIGNAFYTGGEYTVSFPHIGSSYAAGGANATSYYPNPHPDYNKAHVELTTVSGTDPNEEFGNLNYGTKELHEATDNYLKRSSSDPSFAGTSSPYYLTVLPKEDGTVLEMCVDYTLVAIDGSNEEITVYGAKAFVPAAYTKWLPNYAYTYIFKISDNTNGWTNPEMGTDPAGLFPITFDAVVLDSEETGHQTTITTVAEPSITTYQKGHVYYATNSYDKAKKVYVQVMQNGALVTNLSASNKSYFYKVSNVGIELSTEPSDWSTGCYFTDAACTTPAPVSFTANTYYKAATEASVMDALNIRTSGPATTVVGRNGITLTPITDATPAGTESYTITAIPGEDGNDIGVDAGKAGELYTNSGAGTYAYVYDYTTSSPSPDPVYTYVTLSSDPGDWVANAANIYYTYNYSTGNYDVVSTPYAAGSYYKKYQDLNRTYAVKVIKFE